MVTVFSILFFSVARGDRKAFGCNVACRVVDAVFYLMHRFSERGQGILRRILLILEPAGFWPTTGS
jgi:hypothetical protein